MEETLLILQESQYYSLLELVDAEPKWMFSVPDISSRVFDSSICDCGKIISPCLGNSTSFALSLLEWISDASIVSNSSMSATNMSPFQFFTAYQAYPRNNPSKTFFPNVWIHDWSFAVEGSNSTNEPNGIIGPLNGCPKRLS